MFKTHWSRYDKLLFINRFHLCSTFVDKSLYYHNFLYTCGFQGQYIIRSAILLWITLNYLTLSCLYLSLSLSFVRSILIFSVFSPSGEEHSGYASNRWGREGHRYVHDRLNCIIYKNILPDFIWFYLFLFDLFCSDLTWFVLTWFDLIKLDLREYWWYYTTLHYTTLLLSLPTFTSSSILFPISTGTQSSLIYIYI